MTRTPKQVAAAWELLAPDDCDHEPSAVFTAVGGWIVSYICECAKCGRLVTFYPEANGG